MVNNRVEEVSAKYRVDGYFSENEAVDKAGGNNQVPAGYKQTDVGVIPEDWELVKAGEVCGFIVPGRNKPTEFKGDIPWITTPDLVDGESVYLSRSDLNVSKEEAKRVGSKIVPAESVIMSCVGELGLVAIAGRSIVLNQQLHAFLPTEKIFHRFLVYALKRQEKYFYSMATKTALPYLNKENCNATPIILPPLEEQTAIANALSDVDALIANLESLIAKKQAIKTATMQQLLTGRTRLPPFSKTKSALREDGSPKGYKQSELGEVPEDWGVVRLKEACAFINGRAYGLHEWETSGTPVIRLQNLTGRGAEYYYSNLQLPERQYCNCGDLLFMWSATFGPVIWVGEKAIYHYHIWKIECAYGYDKAYLFYLLDDMTEKLKRGSSSGGTMLHVTKEIMESTKAAFPSLNEQTAIATILSDMDQEIQTLEQRLNKTRQIKQGMMQQLLTGKIRLVKSEAT